MLKRKFKHLGQECFFYCEIFSQRYLIPSVIRQKGESQNGCFQKTKHRKFSEHFLPTNTHTCAYHGVRNVRFSENLACLFPWNTGFEIRPFALLPTILGKISAGTFTQNVLVFFKYSTLKIPELVSPCCLYHVKSWRIIILGLLTKRTRKTFVIPVMKFQKDGCVSGLW